MELELAVKRVRRSCGTNVWTPWNIHGAETGGEECPKLVWNDILDALDIPGAGTGGQACLKLASNGSVDALDIRGRWPELNRAVRVSESRAAEGGADWRQQRSSVRRRLPPTLHGHLRRSHPLQSTPCRSISSHPRTPQWPCPLCQSLAVTLCGWRGYKPSTNKHANKQLFVLSMQR